MGLEKWLKWDSFVFDGFDELFHKCHNISLNYSESHIDSTQQLKVKKALRKSNSDDRYLQHAVTFILNYEKIRKIMQEIGRARPVVDQYDWK